MTPVAGYNEMKDSGVPWIGKIPEIWKILRVKNCATMETGFTPPSGNSEYYDLFDGCDWVTISDLNGQRNIPETTKTKISNQYIQKFHPYQVPKGALLYSFKLSVGQLAFTDRPVYTNEAIAAFFPKDGILLEYLYYAARFIEYNANINIYGAKILNQTLIRNAVIPVPPIKNQRKIAVYLDTHCAKIDAMITAAKGNIEDYKALKQSIITQAVTKGLHPNVEMKDSGVKWIGKIPKHWNCSKITRVLDNTHPYPIGDGDHGLVKVDDYVDTGIPYIRVQNLGWGTALNLENLVYITPEKNRAIKNSILMPNDILFAKTGATIGKTGIVPDTIPVANTTSHVGKITVAPQYNPKFIFYVLSSYIGFDQFWEIASVKSTRPELSIDEIKSLQIIIPDSLEEQRKIVDFLDKKCAQIDTLISEQQALIDDLEAAKKSLIFECVTGKRRVC